MDALSCSVHIVQILVNVQVLIDLGLDNVIEYAIYIFFFVAMVILSFLNVVVHVPIPDINNIEPCSVNGHYLWRLA